MEEMPEDLVCKFLRCISVRSWQDPWRINGPARMKGRERRRRESFLSRKSLSSICGEQCLSLSLFLFQFFVLVAPIPDPSLSFSFSLILRFLSASIQPSNKRIDPIYSRGSERLWIKKKKKKIGVSAVHPPSSVSLSLLCSSQIFGIDERCIPWNVSMLPLSPPIPSLSRRVSLYRSTCKPSVYDSSGSYDMIEM